MTKIGLAYIKGAVPGFENFGNLPTDIVKENGLVNGNNASKELDALIIPGGTLIESNDINMDLNKEILKMAKMDKPIIGIRPWGQERVPIKIQENAVTMVGWNSAPLVQAVRDHAI